MFHLIYLSSAVAPFSAADLQALLEISRRNNTASDVTGLLLYRDGDFLQVIEGEEAVLDQLYAKISRDPRHRRMTMLFRESIPSREFGDWSMGFRDLNTAPEQFPEGFNDLLNSSWSEMDLSAFSRKVRPFMKMFAN